MGQVDAGIVDDDVKASELSRCALDGSPDRLGIGQVRLDSHVA